MPDILHQHGFQANYLAGGIKEWGNHYVFRTVQETDNWQIYQVDRAARGCLSYVLISNGGGSHHRPPAPYRQIS
ncbi:MAG: hypothetical protein Q9P01_21755 [Anaerolineae bacterium]|nr:hypothetical protein [Anaerolineae bacterium]